METRSPRLPWWRRWFGSRSEREAARFLKKKGHEILARNWTCDGGEIDLVTRDRETLVFIEIRSTECSDVSRPLLSIDKKKQKQIEKASRLFLRKYHVRNLAVRFDVVTVSWPAGQKKPEISHFPNAFSASSTQPFVD